VNASIGYTSCWLDENSLTGACRGGEYAIADLAELSAVSRAAGYRMELALDTYTGAR
jgi:hypothetical protein